MNQLDARRSSLVPMIVIGVLFFMFGFVTWLNGSLIPFLQIACELTHFQAYFVTMAFYIAYVVTALPVSYVLRKKGFKQGIVLGLLVMVVGALLFIPAAMTRIYGLFLLALFFLGTGLTLLQTASNPYIVLIGPQETAAVRISIMGILNKLAGVVAPLVFTAFVLTDMSQFNEVRMSALDASQRSSELAELSSRLTTPYLVMAVMLALLALFVRLSPLPEPSTEDADSSSTTEENSILEKPRVILGALALFFYVGAEVIAGDTIGLFGKELGVSNFGQLTSYTMGFMVSGYILGMTLIPKLIRQDQALMGSALLGVVFSVLVLNGDTSSSSIWVSYFSWTGIPVVPNAVLYVALFGFANAMAWPTIWPLSLEGLSPKETSTASAILVMGIAGGAIIPLIYGGLAETSLGTQGAYLLMIPCYLFILFYALKGHKLNAWTSMTSTKSSTK